MRGGGGVYKGAETLPVCTQIQCALVFTVTFSGPPRPRHLLSTKHDKTHARWRTTVPIPKPCFMPLGHTFKAPSNPANFRYSVALSESANFAMFITSKTSMHPIIRLAENEKWNPTSAKEKKPSIFSRNMFLASLQFLFF